MKEHPILFNTEMVKAILSGRKTQTRRVIKHQPPSPKYEISTLLDTTGDRKNIGKHQWSLLKGCEMVDSKQPYFSCPYGQVGDRLWVRETFYIDNIYYIDVPLSGRSAPADDSIYYRAEGECCEQISECCCSEVGKVKWRPSIFMPRWASRINLEITDIRVERIQDINQYDADAEGVHREWDGSYYWYKDYLHNSLFKGYMPSRSIESFRTLWDSINKKRGFGWDINPWVWVVEFRMV